VTIRVFIADDHAVVRAGVRRLLEPEPGIDVVGEAADGRTALRLVRELGPDVVVLDISMSGLDGIGVTERLRRLCPETGILVLTTHEQSGYVRRLLRAGARGYLLKRAAPEEFVRAVRAVAEGRVYLDPTLSGLFGDLYRRGSETEPSAAEPTAREAEILQLIAEGYTNKEIAFRLALSVKTVETHKSRSMGKLGLQSRAEVVQYALRRRWLREA
jgi:DNA-binding NarL/FixJ family response regulator